MATNNALNTSLSGQSGTGAFAGTISPVFTTPSLNVASASSINKMLITAPATNSTLAIANGKTLTDSNTLTFTGTDGSSVNASTGGTVLYTTTGFSSINKQRFVAAGSFTYTPTAGMIYCIVECVGGGGGGGAVDVTNSTQVAGSGAGGGGQYTRSAFSAATIGVSQSVTVGIAGVGGTAGPNNGGNGGDTSFGALQSAGGGKGGTGAAANGSSATNNGGAGGSGGTGQFSLPGQSGGNSTSVFAASVYNARRPGGGFSFYGFGGQPASVIAISGSRNSGASARAFGGGGSGASNLISAAATAGITGTAGVVYITEFI